MNKLPCVAISVFLLLFGASPVFAQSGRNDNPNLRNFYMARQQIQITDDVPAVNDLRSNPAAAAAGAPAPTAPQGLPRAGFNSYMSGLAGGGAGRGLPEVNNGVPKLPPAGPNLSGKTAGNPGKLKPAAKSASTGLPSSGKAPVAAKAYKPYATTGSAGVSSGSSYSSSTNVQGSVLHWNKRKTGF